MSSPPLLFLRKEKSRPLKPCPGHVGYLFHVTLPYFTPLQLNKSLPVLPPTAPAEPHLVPAPVAPHLAPVPAPSPAGPDGYVPHPLDHVEGQAYGHDLVGPFYHHSGPFGPFGFYANFFHE